MNSADREQRSGGSDPGSNPRKGIISGLSLLLVRLALRVFHRVLQFSSSLFEALGQWRRSEKGG